MGSESASSPGAQSDAGTTMWDYFSSFFGAAAGGVNMIENAGNVADGVAGARGGFGGYWDAFGGGTISNLFTPVVAGINQFFYDPVTTGPVAQTAERASVFGVNTAWGFASGALGLVDWMTGGNMSGVLRAGAQAPAVAADALFTGDTAGAEVMKDGLFDGDYGAPAAGLAVAGDAAAQLLTGGNQPFDYRPMERAGDALAPTWYNPFTWVAAGAGEAAAWATEDLASTDGDQVMQNLHNLYQSAVQRGDGAGAQKYLNLIRSRGG